VVYNYSFYIYLFRVFLDKKKSKSQDKEKAAIQIKMSTVSYVKFQKENKDAKSEINIVSNYKLAIAEDSMALAKPRLPPHLYPGY